MILTGYLANVLLVKLLRRKKAFIKVSKPDSMQTGESLQIAFCLILLSMGDTSHL